MFNFTINIKRHFKLINFDCLNINIVFLAPCTILKINKIYSQHVIINVKK